MLKLLAVTVFAVYGLWFAPVAFAQDGKVPVYVMHSGDDSIGSQFVFALREAIRGSQGYKITGRDESGIQVRVVTVNPDEKSQANWTVASVVITMSNFLPFEKGKPQTWYPIYMTASVLTVGQQMTSDQAKAVMASLDRALQKYRDEARN